MRNGKFEKATTDLRRDLGAIARDAEALLKATADSGSERVQELRAKTDSTLRQVRESMNMDALTGQMRESAHGADKYAHDHPWRLVAAAAGTGLLVGLLSARRH